MITIRREIAWVVIIVTGIYTFFRFAMGVMVYGYGYRPEANSFLMFVRYIQPLLVLPFFLLALVPWRWATVPLWLVSLSMSIFPYVVDAQQKAMLGFWATPFARRDIIEITHIMLIPVVVQIAVWLKSKSIVAGERVL